MRNKDIAAIILAAGKGTRMKSEVPKVLHPVCKRPMIGYVLDLVNDLKLADSVTVLGYKHKEVSAAIPRGMKQALQKQMKGTADAVKTALPYLKGFKGSVIILYGDAPLLKKEVLEKLIARHKQSNAAATILTAKMENPAGYGRILRDQYLTVCGIAEDKDADEFQKEIKEINTGIICFNKDALWGVLKQIKPNNQKKEYYLTDAIALLHGAGKLIESVEVKDALDALGINSRVDLEKANRVMQQRINERWMLKGVTIIDSGATFISFDARIGSDTVIYPFTVIEKNVKIGKKCSLGPFIRLRPGTELKDEVCVGNFLEISRSKVGPQSQAKHFGFIGDSNVGRFVNVGAGAVTANYDGKNKNKTVIKNKAFIGCDSVLIAPVVIGKGAKTGAGAVVTRNTRVADGDVVVGIPARSITAVKKK